MSPDILTTLLSNVWSIFLVVLFFGASIFVHELGHFLAARRRGVHVERFSIGFGPKMFSWKGKDGVEYRISWFPLGGYVMIPQLSDLQGLEGDSDVEIEKLPPVTYGTKMLVFVAGATFNIIFAFLLASILWFVGQPVVKEEQTTMIGFVRTTLEDSEGNIQAGPAYTAGLRAGDVIHKVDNRQVGTFTDIRNAIVLGSGHDDEKNQRHVSITYERESQMHTVGVYPLLIGDEKFRAIGLEPSMKVMISSVQADSPADMAGLKYRDIITAVDEQPVEYLAFISEYLSRNDGKAARITYLREGQTYTTLIQPRLVIDEKTQKKVYRIGIGLGGSFTKATLRTPPWTLMSQVTRGTFDTLISLVSPKSDVGLSKLSGPIGIANTIRVFAKLDIRLVIWFVVLININLAIFNLLPIPVLDGGQMFFATIGKLRGRALPTNFIMATQSTFVILLFSMILYVTFFDVRRIVRANISNEPAPKEQVEKK